ncbi:MAG TPA: hypothetical protein VJB57_16535, partial [Dehalococcoidia bacterium]|nr:hypothetical protein [Dehalococcoidia bacterium]
MDADNGTSAPVRRGRRRISAAAEPVDASVMEAAPIAEAAPAPTEQPSAPPARRGRRGSGASRRIGAAQAPETPVAEAPAAEPEVTAAEAETAPAVPPGQAPGTGLGRSRRGRRGGRDRDREGRDAAFGDNGRAIGST